MARSHSLMKKKQVSIPAKSSDPPPPMIRVAVVVVVNAYIIIWIARRLQIVASHSRKAVGPVLCDEDDHVQEIAVSNFSKISTIPASQGVGSCSSKSRRPLQEVTKWDLAGHSEVSDATCNGSQSFAKLSMILVLALGGLACSHFAAVCLCSFCILLLSILQGSTTTRRRRLRLNR